MIHVKTLELNLQDFTDDLHAHSGEHVNEFVSIWYPWLQSPTLHKEAS